jgi:hypothetical protein
MIEKAFKEVNFYSYLKENTIWNTKVIQEKNIKRLKENFKTTKEEISNSDERALKVVVLVKHKAKTRRYWKLQENNLKLVATKRVTIKKCVMREKAKLCKV